MKFIFDFQEGLSARGIMEVLVNRCCPPEVIKLHDQIFDKIDWLKVENLGLSTGQEVGSNAPLIKLKETLAWLTQNSSNYSEEDYHYVMDFWHLVIDLFKKQPDTLINSNSIGTINQVVLGTKSVLSFFPQVSYGYMNIHLDGQSLQDPAIGVLKDHLFMIFSEHSYKPSILGMLLLVFVKAEYVKHVLALNHLMVHQSHPRDHEKVRLISGESFKIDNDQHSKCLEIRFNVDDMTGEELSFAGSQLTRVGALDFYWTPIMMKKGRPGTLVTLSCLETYFELVRQTIFQVTSTNGIKVYRPHRFNLQTKEYQVMVEENSVVYKEAIGYGTQRYKWEYESIKQLAIDKNISLQQARQLADRERNLLENASEEK